MLFSILAVGEMILSATSTKTGSGVAWLWLLCWFVFSSPSQSMSTSPMEGSSLSWDLLACWDVLWEARASKASNSGPTMLVAQIPEVGCVSMGQDLD